MSIWTDTLGAEVRFRQAGPWRTRSVEAGEGPAVVAMGGLTGHAEGFSRNVVPLAARGLRVHAIDCLGHGLTDRPLDVTYHAPVFTEHLLRYLDAIEVDQAHLVGQSLGGWVALHAALHHPDRVGRIVSVTGAGLLAPSTDDAAQSVAVHQRVKDVTAKAASAPTLANVRARLEWLMADPASVTDELVAVRHHFYTLPGGEPGLAKLVAEQPSEENRAYLLGEDELKQIPHETLVLWSDRNPTTPASVGEWAAGVLPNGRFDMIRAAGHWPMFEQPDAFNRVVGDFLTGS